MRDNPSALTDKTVNIVKDIDMSAYTWVPMTYTIWTFCVPSNVRSLIVTSVKLPICAINALEYTHELDV